MIDFKKTVQVLRILLATKLTRELVFWNIIIPKREQILYKGTNDFHIINL